MNPHRGETKLNLAGNSYNVKLTLDGIAKIENSTGCSIIKIAQKLSQGDLTVTEIGSILLYAIRSGGNNVSQAEVNTMIWNEGLVNSMKLTGDLITIALDTGEQGKG
jgi:hypothetical protein